MSVIVLHNIWINESVNKFVEKKSARIYAYNMENFKGHGGGKNSGWEEKIFFKCFAFSR